MKSYILTGEYLFELTSQNLKNGAKEFSNYQSMNTKHIIKTTNINILSQMENK